MYPVSKSILLDGIEQRLLFPAGPSSLCLGTPEREPTAVDLLVAVPSPVITDFCTRREALRTQFDIRAVGAAKSQVCDICKAVNAVLFPQVGHVALFLLLVVGGRTAPAHNEPRSVSFSLAAVLILMSTGKGVTDWFPGPSFQDNLNKTNRFIVYRGAPAFTHLYTDWPLVVLMIFETQSWMWRQSTRAVR